MLKNFRLLLGASLAALAIFARAANPAATHEPVRVACIGDSITFGLGIADRNATYPADLQRLLGAGYLVGNFGHSGCTVTRDTFSGWPRGYIKQREHAAALAFRPDIVVCNLGLNDISSFADAARANFVRDYLEIIAAFRALPSHPRIILWHPLSPLFPGHTYYGRPIVQETNALIAEVAATAKTETVDLFAPLAAHPEDFFHDHIHPNPAGAQRIAEVIRAYLASGGANRPEVGSPALRQ